MNILLQENELHFFFVRDIFYFFAAYSSTFNIRIYVFLQIKKIFLQKKVIVDIKSKFSNKKSKKCEKG